MVTENGSTEAVLVRMSDHGELLGAHGGIHQKWFNLYDEATRIPFYLARIGASPTTARAVTQIPTSHVDLLPTLLAAAGLDQDLLSSQLRESFSEVHPLPGRDLMAKGGLDPDRAVYLMTRDNMLEGDSGLSGLARRLGRTSNPPMPLRIRVAAPVASSFEGVVARVDGHLWKLVRTFDDPSTWTVPGVRHLAANGRAGVEFRTEALPDQWELYDLDHDANEANNRWRDDSAVEIFAHLCQRLKEEQQRCVPERHHPWPYAVRRSEGSPVKATPPPPARLLRRLVQRIGMHPEDANPVTLRAPGKRALVVCTNHDQLGNGKKTGVFASEMTVPYYYFLDAGMDVDVARPLGGVIPVDPQSLKPVLRSEADDRYLGDEVLQAKTAVSLAIADLDMASYDLVFLAEGWGAAFDFGVSQPLALRNATTTDGMPLVEGHRLTAVTDEQVRDVRITGQKQNAGPMVARETVEQVLSR